MIRPMQIVLLIVLSALLVHADDKALVGVWHFDEESGSIALDATHRENDGRLIGGVERVAGKFGRALKFNGKDGCVEMMGVGRLPAGSVEAWVKFDRVPKGQVGVVSFCKGNRGKSDAALLGFNGYPKGSDPSAFCFSVCSNEWIAAKGQAKPEVGKWVHLAATWDRSGMRCYVNGAQAAENARWQGGLPAHAAVLIGAGSWSAYLACTIDEVRIYKRALSPEEIKAHCESPGYAAAPPHPAGRTGGLSKGAMRNLADFFSAESPTSGIQEAIHALPIRGGVVVIPPGVYMLKRSVMVPSNVTLRGSGASSVLRKCAEAQTKMAEATAKGSGTLKVLDAKGFEVGMQICVTSRGKGKWLGGWYCSQPVITGIDGSVLKLSDPLEKDYDPATSTVINYFPAIWIERKKNVVVENITIDGNIAGNPGLMSDFTCEGIHCVASQSIRIRNCVVRDWPSDGIGVQGGGNVFVTGCEVSGCRSNGFHPGTSLHHATFSDNIAHNNKGDGLYFCMNVRYINVTNSVFYENGRHGIGGIGGGKMPGRDQYNVVSGNTCESNAQAGIQVIQGNHNIVANNVCRNNSQAKPGAFPGILVRESEDIVVTGNLCTDEREGEKKTQAYGIAEEKGSDHNIITSNNCRGNLKGGVVTVGKGTTKANNLQ